MSKGYVLNNTGRSKHIFQRTVYPGQKVPLDKVYKLMGSKVPEGTKFVDWLEKYLPNGWEVNASEEDESNFDSTGGRRYKEVLTAVPVVTDTPIPLPIPMVEDETPSIAGKPVIPIKAYITPKEIDKLTAKDIYELRMKDNPKRILKNITSIHKLRRALGLCKKDGRKSVLTRLIQGRIRQLNITL